MQDKIDLTCETQSTLLFLAQHCSICFCRRARDLHAPPKLKRGRTLQLADNDMHWRSASERWRTTFWQLWRCVLSACMSEKSGNSSHPLRRQVQHKHAGAVQWSRFSTSSRKFKNKAQHVVNRHPPRTPQKRTQTHDWCLRECICNPGQGTEQCYIFFWHRPNEGHACYFLGFLVAALENPVMNHIEVKWPKNDYSHVL